MQTIQASDRGCCSINFISMMLKHNFHSFNSAFQELLTTQYISIGATDVPTGPSAQNLGVTFDEHMGLESHVKNVRYSCLQWKYSTIWPAIIRHQQVADGSACSCKSYHTYPDI